MQVAQGVIHTKGSGSGGTIPSACRPAWTKVRHYGCGGLSSAQAGWTSEAGCYPLGNLNQALTFYITSCRTRLACCTMWVGHESLTQRMTMPKIRKLSYDDWLQLSNLMENVSDPDTTYTATGWHYELMNFLGTVGYRPAGH